jgi:hypothetical protein
MNHRITTQRALRKAFWLAHPTLPRKRIKNYAGNGLMYPTDTRCAWVDWIDALARSNSISDELAERATLDTN